MRPLYSLNGLKRKEKFNTFWYVNTSFKINVFKVFIKKLIKLNSNSYPVTVIATGMLPLVLLSLASFVFNFKKIIIIHGHEILMGNFFIQKFIRSALKKSDSIIAVSNFSKNQVLDRLPFLDVKVINNGADFNRFNVKSVNEMKMKGKINLVTVGSISKRKGQHNVIKSLPLISKYYPNLSYNIVGIDNNKDFFGQDGEKIKC